MLRFHRHKLVTALVAVSALIPGFAHAGDAVHTDIFGRPYTGWSGLWFYCVSEPYDPIPQLWGHRCGDFADPVPITDDFNRAE